MRALYSVVFALAVASLQCGRPCPSGRFCGVATWVSGADEPIVEGSAFVLVATGSSDPDRGPFVSPEELELRPRAVSIRFDLAALRARGTTVERATLLLSPHPRWRTLDRSVRISVQAATGGSEPGALSDYSSTATIPLAMRAPVRVDITRAVRGWWDGSLPSGSLAVSADQDGMVVQSASATDARERPRVEVVVR